MSKHRDSGFPASHAGLPPSQATASAAPVNGAPSENPSPAARPGDATRPTKPAQLAVACVLAEVPPKGVTALLLTFADPAQQILGVAHPYVAALHAQLEQLAPTMADLDKLELLVAAAGVDVDAVGNKLADALQLLEVMETAPLDTPVSFDETLDQVHELVAGAIALLRPRGRATIVGRENLAAIGAQLEHESRVAGQADGAP